MQNEYIFKQPDAEWQPLLQSSLWVNPLNEAQLRHIAETLGHCLQQRHAANSLYGQWSEDNVFVQNDSCYLLDQEPFAPSPLMAFELLADDEAAWPVTSAVDVYGLGMLLRQLMCKESLPLASERWLNPLAPLRGRDDLAHISPRFRRAVDLATELNPHERMSSIDEFLLYVGIAAPVAKISDVTETATHVASVPVAASTPVQPVPSPVAPLGAESIAHESVQPIEVETVSPSGTVAAAAMPVAAPTRTNKWLYAVCAALVAVIVALLFQLGNNDEASREAPQLAAQPSENPQLEPSLAATEQSSLPVDQMPADMPEHDGTEAVISSESDSNHIALDLNDANAQDTAEVDALIASLREPDPLAMTPVDDAEQLEGPVEESSENSEAAIDNSALTPPDEPEPAVDAPEPAPRQVANTQPAATQQATTNTVAVQLSIFPWGDVYVNNRRQGASPPLKSLNLRPGRYQIQVRNGELPPYNTTLEVSEGSELTIRHRF